MATGESEVMVEDVFAYGDGHYSLPIITYHGQSLAIEDDFSRSILMGLFNADPFNHQDIYPLDDIGTSQLFADLFGEYVCYCPETQTWYSWEETRWVQDIGSLRVSDYMADMVEALKFYVLALRNADFTNERVINYEKYVRRLFAKSRRDTAISDAERLLVSHIDRFDALPRLVNTRYGTLDLETGIVHEPEKGEWLTMSTSFEYSSKALCPRWYTFLDEMTGGQEWLKDYLQKAVGYTLFGEAVEDCMFILYGSTTRNGKSTFLNAVQTMLGDYATTMPPEFICSVGSRSEWSSSEAASPALAALRGVRMVTMSEPKAGHKLNEGLIKSLTGGEQIKARPLYGKTITFTPNFVMWMSCNDLPAVTDRSLFSSHRLRVIELNNHVPESKRDTTLRQQLCTEEAKAAIFLWAVEGYRKYKQEGLKDPEPVIQMAKQYESDNDLVWLFVQEACVRDEDKKEKRTRLYKAFDKWCQSNGYSRNQMSSTKFYREMERLGFERLSTNGDRYFKGVGIR